MPWFEKQDDPEFGRTMLISEYPGGPPQKVGPIRESWESPVEIQRDGTTEKHLDLFVGAHPKGNVTRELPGARWLQGGDIFGRPEHVASFTTTEGNDENGHYIRTLRNRRREDRRFEEITRLRQAAGQRAPEVVA